MFILDRLICASFKLVTIEASSAAIQTLQQRSRENVRQSKQNFRKPV